MPGPCRRFAWRPATQSARHGNGPCSRSSHVFCRARGRQSGRDTGDNGVSAVDIFVMLAVVTAATDEGPKISPASDEHGVAVHNVESSLQGGTTQIRVLLPDALRADKKY